MTKVKICGLRRSQDLRVAIAQGADFVGFINYSKSPRYVDQIAIKELVSQARKQSASVQTVLVLVSDNVTEIEAAAAATGCDFVQLHTNLSAKDFNAIKVKKIKVFSVKSALKLEDITGYKADYYLFDTYSKEKQGGTGQVFDWDYVPKAVLEKSFIAGGLCPENAVLVVQKMSPFAVDLNSGLELCPAQKSKAKIEKLFRLLKRS